MMVVEKEGVQLDHSTWETLRGLVHLEVASQAHLWSDTLEKSNGLIHSRLEEFQGVVNTIDKEYSATLRELGERQGHLESKLASVSVDLHQISATARGELRRASIELDGKLTSLGQKDKGEILRLDNKLDREVKTLREQQRTTSADLLMRLQDLQQQVVNDRAEGQATQTRCMHYADRQLAAAMASKELEARFQAVRDTVCELDEKLQKVEASIRVDLTRHSEELSATLSARLDDMAQLGERRHAESHALMKTCDNNASQAAASADKAVRLVDESLHQKVHTASHNLMEQIEAAAARSAEAGHAGDFTGEAPQAAAQQVARRAQELQAGFYSLVAREALDTEIRALVDRATRRLQIVADDLAQRSATIQDHVVAAEERLCGALEFAQRQAAEIEAQK